MKTIRISKQNKTNLEKFLKMERNYLELSSGMYIVVGFDDRMQGIYTRKALDSLYTMTGEQLPDGFVAIERKALTV
jgi:hypothetical protein